MRAGERFGRYEIQALIGHGGMGEVWRALDTSLHREVAIKTLPGAMAGDPDRLARFDREAKLLAALKHPNIASIYGLEESDGTRFLVLELVEGGTLADRLTRGRVPVDEALQISLQLAQALEAAHEKGILHRDLKPANISVTPEGTVKVLDFGLAKTIELPAQPADTATAVTLTGVAVGTPAYMSPEQARGEVVGRQTDIWSFGAVLYELLTGTSAFGGRSAADTLAQLIGRPPDYARLPPDTPASIERLLRRCLEQDLKRRLQHIGDARIEIEAALAGELAEPVGRAAPESIRRSSRTLWLTLAMAGLAALAGWFVARRSTVVAPPAVARLSLSFPDAPMVLPMGSNHIAISPDGSTLAFTSNAGLHIRRMDRNEPVASSVTGAFAFFSPDGKWIGVLGTTDGLTKMPVAGGAPITLAATSQRSAGATWHSNGTIVFATTEGLYGVSENGGDARLLIAPKRERRETLYAWPSFLPDGRALLFTIIPEDGVAAALIAVLDLASLETRVLLTGGTSARYVPTGHLVYASGSTLRTIGFEPGPRKIRGEPQSVSDVVVGSSPTNGAADFAVADAGTLVFLPPANPSLSTLRWIDRQGKEEVLEVEPRTYGYPRVSPDGTRVALDVNAGGNRDIWILDLARMTQARLTDGPSEDLLPVWSVDGRRVFFGSNRNGNFDIYSQAADGASPARAEFSAPGTQMPESFTPGGDRLTVYEDFKDTGLLTLTAPPRFEKLLYGPFDDRLVQVSPDGRWIAYESDESGRGQFEIMLRSFPDIDRRREQVSVNGGRFPRWGRKGRQELYYVDLDGAMMAVPLTLTPDLALGRVQKLFDWEKPPTGRAGRRYDISPRDGRFILPKRVVSSPTGPTHASIVLNWLSELRAP